MDIIATELVTDAIWPDLSLTLAVRTALGATSGRCQSVAYAQCRPPKRSH